MACFYSEEMEKMLSKWKNCKTRVTCWNSNWKNNLGGIPLLGMEYYVRSATYPPEGGQCIAIRYQER